MNSIRDYFTKDLNSAIEKMSFEEMAGVLRELEGTHYWVAILKYNQERLNVCQSVLFTTDPHKDPTEISRNQGIMLGLSDLQGAIIQLVKGQQQAEEEKEEE